MQILDLKHCTHSCPPVAIVYADFDFWVNWTVLFRI
jgi:hypothetical protein